jgi:hypothetical protein
MKNYLSAPPGSAGGVAGVAGVVGFVGVAGGAGSGLHPQAVASTAVIVQIANNFLIVESPD